MKRGRATGGVEKLVHRADEAFERRDFYEALQLVKTIASRHEANGNTAEARRALLDGAEKMARAGQDTSAAELCTLAQKGDSWATECGDRIVAVCSAMQRDVSSRRRVLSRLADAAPGRSDAHMALADAAAQLGDLAAAHRHLLAARAPPERIVALVSRAAEDGEPSEWDLFVSRSAMLCARDVGAVYAVAVLSGLLESHRGTAESPLVNFVRFVLTLARTQEAATSQAADAFRSLRTRYAAALLDRDPSLAKLADRVGEKLFGVAPEARQQAPAASFGDILGSIIGSVSQPQQGQQPQQQQH